MDGASSFKKEANTEVPELAFYCLASSDGRKWLQKTRNDWLPIQKGALKLHLPKQT